MDGSIGIVDCNGLFKGEIGSFEIPTQTSVQYGFGPLGDALLPFSAFQTAFGPGNTQFCLLNSDGSIGDPFLDYTNAEVDLTSLNDFIDWFNSRPFPDYFSAIAEVYDTDKIKITTTFKGFECYYGLALKRITFEYPQISNWAAEIESVSSFPTTQYQANVTIPFLKNGIYFLILFNDSELYSISNPIKIDSADCFSKIIEFWGDENSIVEGFEYFNGWKQRIRIGLNGGGHQTKIEESIYRNSDGTYQRPQSLSDLSINLQTDYVDLNAQKALFSATRHPAFVWDNQNLFVEGDLEIANTQDFSNETTYRNLSQMSFREAVS